LPAGGNADAGGKTRGLLFGDACAASRSLQHRSLNIRWRVATLHHVMTFLEILETFLEHCLWHWLTNRESRRVMSNNTLGGEIAMQCQQSPQVQVT
jgi:hypothetical protein